MNTAAALIYWPIVAAWTTIVLFVFVKYLPRARQSKVIRLLLIVIAVDATRNIVENIYFGLLWGGNYGIFPEIFAQVLSEPGLLILPKVLNVMAACCVLVLLVFRHLTDALLDKDRAESQLEVTEQRFRMLVDSVKEYAIYMLDVDGNITSWNAGAERIKGYDAEDAIGMNESVFYTVADRQSGAPMLALARAKSEGHYETRAERVRKDGSTFWATVAINAIYNTEGEIIGFAKVTKDITERHTAAKLLEHQAHHDQLTGLLNRSSLQTMKSGWRYLILTVSRTLMTLKGTSPETVSCSRLPSALAHKPGHRPGFIGWVGTSLSYSIWDGMPLHLLLPLSAYCERWRKSSLSLVSGRP